MSDFWVGFILGGGLVFMGIFWGLEMIIGKDNGEVRND